MKIKLLDKIEYKFTNISIFRDFQGCGLRKITDYMYIRFLTMKSWVPSTVLYEKRIFF